MDYRQFTDQILKGASQGAPNGAIPELANAMTGAFRAAAVARPGKAQGQVAQVQADEEEKRAAAAASARANEIKDLLDPGKYDRRRKDDGGFAFFDPTGKEIDIDTYAKRTGMRRAEILADSENPVDLQFIDDYNTMNEINQAVWRNDSSALKDLKMDYPDLFSGDKSPTIEELNRKMLEKYPHIFGRGNYQVSKSNLGKPLFRMSNDSMSMTPSPQAGSQGWTPKNQPGSR